MDVKYKDVEAMADDSILVTLFNGGIRTAENEHMARLMRRVSKILVAFGSCANEGCIPGLANLSSREVIFDTAYTGPRRRTRRHTTARGGARRRGRAAPTRLRARAGAPSTRWWRSTTTCRAVRRSRTRSPPSSTCSCRSCRARPNCRPRHGDRGGQSTVCDECPRQRDVKHITGSGGSRRCRLSTRRSACSSRA